MALALTGVKSADLASKAGISRSALSNMMALDKEPDPDKPKKRNSPNLASMQKVKDALSARLSGDGYVLRNEGVFREPQ